MASKCDMQLTWWISLANLYRQKLPAVANPEAGDPSFAIKVRTLAGQRPSTIEGVLHQDGRLNDPFATLLNKPNESLWKLAGVANAILSQLCELQAPHKLPKKITIWDWSDFVAPLELSISSDGQVVQAVRPEPLANDLLKLIQGRNVASFGTCPICGRLFERRRRDQQCDRRTCRDTARQRRFRRRRQDSST